MAAFERRNILSLIKLCEALARSSFLQHSWQHPWNSSSFLGLHATSLTFLLTAWQLL